MTIEKTNIKKICQKCALQGIRSTIHLFQISDKESLLMCKNADCTFMPSDDLESFVVKRDLTKLTVKSKSINTSSALSLSSFACSSTPLSAYNSFRGPKSSSSDTENCSQPHQTGSSVSPKIFLRPTTPSSEIHDRKSLVPFAPFLSGHAHNFYSFQTSKIEGLKNRHLTYAEEGLAKKAKIDISSFTDNKKNTYTSFDSHKSISYDPGLPKSNNTKNTLIPNGSIAKIGNSVLKIRYIQDKKIESTDSLRLPANDETKVIVKPVGLLEDIRKDCSTESSLFYSHTSKSTKTHIVPINDHLIANSSHIKLTSNLDKIENSTLLTGANQTRQYTPKKNKRTADAKKNKGEPDIQKNKDNSDTIKSKGNINNNIDLPISTDSQLVCNLECFDFNQEVTEFDEYYINNFADL